MKIYIYLILSSVAQFPGHDVLHVPLKRRPRTILVEPWTNLTLALGTDADGGQLWGLVTVAGAAPWVAVCSMELSPIKSSPGNFAERTPAHGSILKNKMIGGGTTRPRVYCGVIKKGRHFPFQLSRGISFLVHFCYGQPTGTTD